MSGVEVSTEGQIEISDDLDAFANDFFGEKPNASPPAKVEAEQDDEHDDGAAAADAPETNEPDEDLTAEYVEPTPKKKTVQDRIDEVVRQREDTKRELERKLQEQRVEFEAKLAALAPTKAPTADAEPNPEALNEDGSPKYTLGEFDPAFIRDLTRHTLNTERAQAAQRSEQERQIEENRVRAEALQSSWNTKLEAAKQTYPDLQEKAQPLLDSFGGLNQDYAGYLATVLQSMDHGPDVLYYLSTNPDEARAIVNSGAQKATLALGRIEAKFIEDAAQKTLAKPRVSKAPPPPTASARGTGGGGNSIAPDTDDLDAFASVFFAPNKRRN
jgi:hypothetical protein